MSKSRKKCAVVKLKSKWWQKYHNKKFRRDKFSTHWRKNSGYDVSDGIWRLFKTTDGEEDIKVSKRK